MRGESFLILFIFILTFLLSGLTQFTYDKADFDSEIEVHFDGNSMKVSIDYWIGETSYSKSIRVLCFPTVSEREDDIFIYNDYTGANGTFYPIITGLYDHLRAIMEAYDYSGEVRMIGPDELPEVFSGQNATLIIASEPRGREELAPAAYQWVKRGGVIIGIGNRSIPFVYDGNGTTPDGFMLLRYHQLDFDGGRDMIATPVATAFDLETVAPSKGIVVEDVLELGGKAVGYIYQRETELTSAALFDIGQGRLLALSGDMILPSITSGEDAVSRDLAKWLTSHFLWAADLPVMEERYAGPESISGTLNASFSPAPFLSFVIFDRDYFQDLFYSRTVATDHFNSFVLSTISHI